MLNVKTLDIVYASDLEEFFYKDTDEPVSEGDPVGLDIDNAEVVDFVLFSDVYWSSINLPSGV